MNEALSEESVKLVLLIVTAIFSWINNRQGKIIHTLVNSKMTTALSRIDELERELKELKITKITEQ